MTLTWYTSFNSDYILPPWFSALAVLVLAIIHERVRRMLLARSGIRSRLASRVKRQAEQLSFSDSQLRQAVQQSKVAQQALLEHLPIHVVQKDLEGRFTFASQSYCRLLGKPIEQVIGKRDEDFYPAQVAQKFHDDDQRVIANENVFDDVEPNRDADGHPGFMQVRKAPLRDATGRIVGVQAVFWDVTKEYTNRLQLQRIESRAHALIQAALDAVLIVDADGRVLEANPASEKILGYTPKQMQEHPLLGAMMRLGSEKSDCETARSEGSSLGHTERSPVNNTLKQATGQRIEVRLQRRDGSLFDAELSAHPLTIEQSTGWAIFIRDITRRKRSEAELRAAKEAAEHANAAKSEFVANVSHELRTPLTAIVGLHELLDRAELNQQQSEYLSLARTSSNNLLTLIDDLLDFSKIEANRLEIEKAEFNLIDCVELAGTALAARAQLRGLELVIDLSPDLPRQVIGDAHRVQQVLLNLIGNAIKFTQRGDIHLRATLMRASIEGASSSVASRVRFEVLDSGIGIESHQRDVIFEAFRQADSSMTRRFGGTGLGLAISRNLVHLMGGEMGVQSEPGRGSCFFFELDFPVAQQALALDPHPSNIGLPASVVLACAPSLWRDCLERELCLAGVSATTMNVEQLIARQPAGLFAAGNQTVVIADLRELSNTHQNNPPVVARWILLVPLAHPCPALALPWLKFANVTWLKRPVRRADLRSALASAASTGDGANPDDEETGDTSATAAVGRVLLVEDSPISQTVLSGMLRQLGHEVTLAENGAQAITACASQEFDLVLMDLQMPEIDGIEATRRIRLAEAPSGIRHRIFALTAHAMAGDRQNCHAAGMDGFLIKPISLDLLAATIAEAIKARQSTLAGTTELQPSSADDNSSNATRQLEFESAPSAKKILELVGGNAQLLRDVLELFATEAPRLHHLFLREFAADNQLEARRAIHTLKSNLRYVGLDESANYVAELERLVKRGQVSSLDEYVEPLNRLVQSSVAQVTRLLQNLPKSSDMDRSRS